MLSKKYAEPVRNILILVLIGVFSFFVVTSWLPDRDFIQDSLESVEESSNTVMKFSAATLSTSLAISALPDDFATPLADSLADMNIYFIAILVMLHFEQLLIRYGVKLAFAIAIPAACGIGILSILLKKDLLKASQPELPCSVWLLLLSFRAARILPTMSLQISQHMWRTRLQTRKTVPTNSMRLWRAELRNRQSLKSSPTCSRRPSTICPI